MGATGKGLARIPTHRAGALKEDDCTMRVHFRCMCCAMIQPRLVGGDERIRDVLASLSCVSCGRLGRLRLTQEVNF